MLKFKAYTSQGIRIVDNVTSEFNAERVIKNRLGEDTEIFYMKEIDDYDYDIGDDEDWEHLFDQEEYEKEVLEKLE